jgi:dihydroxyacetone kinase-like protein
MKSISLSDVEHAVRTIAETVIANENYFSELDGTCGDGDFGTSLATGFRTVLGKWRHAAQLNGWNPGAGRCEPR